MRQFTNLALLSLAVVFASTDSTVAASSDTDAGSASANAWQVGVAKQVITPAEPIWMSGYASRNRPAEGKHNDLWAKVMVLQTAAHDRTVLISLDLIGIDYDLSHAICRTLEQKHGLARHQIAICTSHTHSGPAVGKNLRSMLRNVLDAAAIAKLDAYAQRLHNIVVDLVDQAIASVAPAQISWGTGFTTFAVNRRENRADQVLDYRKLGQLQGPVDYDVPVLAVRTPTGELRAVLFGYACHATVLSGYEWCGDYPGFAHEEIERNNPGAVALFWAGCGADQNPLPRRDVELARKYGTMLADAVQLVLDGRMVPVAGQLAGHYQEIPLAFDELPSREQLVADTQSDNQYVVARAEMLLEQIDQGTPLRPNYPYPVQTLRIGNDVVFILLGGEVVVDYALRFKAALGGRRIWVAGYANDVMAYIPSRRVLDEGGYEGGGAMVYYGQPTVWGPQVEEAIVGEVRRQFQLLAE